MTPRYTWTPASEPPDSSRPVLGWQKRGYWVPVHCLNGNWYIEQDGRHTWTVTHWRDVEPPNSSATLTGSGEGKE